MANQDSLNLKFKGIMTDPNNLSAVPTGALEIADNIDIDRDDIAESRRGLSAYGVELSAPSKSLIVYKEKLLAHYSNKLAHDSTKLVISSITSTSSGTITAISGSPASITSNAHGLSDGDVVIIDSSDCVPSVDGRWEVENSATNTFELVGGPNITGVGTAGNWHKHLTLATATTASAHGLVVSQQVTITGSNQDEYNVVNVPIQTVPSTTTFTFNIANTTVSPANTSDVMYLQSGVWTDNSGTLSEPESGRRVKSVELNGNLYLTSSDGIKKLTDPAAALGTAGIPKGLNAVVELYNEPGFFTQENQVAYRVVWGIRDANNNLLLGAPSQREVVICSGAELFVRDFNALLIKLDADSFDGSGAMADGNYAQLYTQPSDATVDNLLTAMQALATKLDTDIGGAVYSTILSNSPAISASIVSIQDKFDSILAALDADAAVTFTNYLSTLAYTASQQVQLTLVIPAGITTSHFFQVYRTSLSDDVATGPGDECKLCYEANPTSGEISAGSVTFIDITPQSFLGASLYTNETQEGINQANDVPPFAKDIASYKNSIFYANTKTKHHYELSLLGVTDLVGRLSYLDSSDVASIVNVSGNTWRFTFTLASGITLSEVTTSHRLVVTSATNAGNNGTFPITNINVGSNYIDITNASGVAESPTSPAVASFKGDTVTINSVAYEFRADQAEVSRVVCADDSAISNLDYFLLYAPIPEDSPRKYAVWFYKGAGTPTIPADTVLVKVDISAATTDVMVATALKNAIDALSDFTATVATATVTITCANGGPTTNITNGVGTGVTLSTIIGGYLGESSASKYARLSDNVSIGTAVDETARSLINVLNLDNSNSVVGYYQSGSNDVPGKMLFEKENIVDTSFSVVSSDDVSFSPDISTSQTSDNEELGNRIYYSKTSQPEAVPYLNYLDVGSRELPIQRILALRDSLFVFKKDGIYRITGESVSALQSSLFDSSAKLIAPESAVVGNNQVFAFTDQGVIALSDTGLTVVSRAIERTLLPFYGPALSTLTSNYSFGLFYETERKYLLWLPSVSSDTTATQAYIYNTFNNSWTRYPIAKTCGVLNTTDDKIYLGAAEDNYIEQERKDFSYRDQADRRIAKAIVDSNVADELTITSITIGKPTTITVNSPHDLAVGDFVIINDSNSVPVINGKYKVLRVPSTNKFSIATSRVTNTGTSGTVTKLTKRLQLSSIANVAAGDVIVQPFFLNVSRFNALLGKLDTDNGLNLSNYFSTLKVTTKDEIPQAIVDLTTKLNADAGSNSKYYTTLESGHRNIQYQFNSLVEVLNQDVGVADSNYTYSNNHILKEVPILSVDSSTSEVTISYDADLTEGDCYIYKAIESVVQWVPQHSGDASVDKQHTEAQVMFSELNGSFINIGFKTEISPYLEEVQVAGQGNGAWGLFGWGDRPFGLTEVSEDLRTLIPTEKQRGRLIIPRVRHSNAYETYSMNGIAIIFRTVAHRVNR